ncbi:WD40 repeat domain-containing protein [Candidatus Dependentiae bacterium]|jgi:WD40 repeat protein|nr:WD40 repeat domain-containing protein [Candidatus Dependentiae bacterium]
MVTRLMLILTIVLLANTAQAMNGNFFEQGVHQRVKCLLNIFNPAIKVFTTCSENLQENPGVENFQANFEVINSAYKELCKKIEKDPTILLEFMELNDTDLIKRKIEIMQRFFVDFEQAIAVNNPSCRLLEVQQEQHSLEHILCEFIQNKRHCDALACGNIQSLEALQSMGDLSACGIEIAVQPDVGDDEKLAQALQLQLNLELMHEREAREQEAQKENLICESSEIEMIEYSDENFPSQALVNDQHCKKGARIFSGATSDTQFVAQLKQIINHVDITQDLDQGLFDRLSAQVPNNFSMLMNREIGRASRYDVMQHSFSESSMTSYAHYFPECLMVGDNEGAEVSVSILEGHTNWVNCVKQLDDGRLVSCSKDKTIKIWDLDTNRCVAILEGHTSSVKCIKRLNDGRLVSCSNDNTIKVWDLNTNRCVATLEGHTDWVNCITQLDDGRLVSGSDDGTIKVWDLDTSRCVATLEGHKHWIRCIKLRKDGRLICGFGDGMIKVWDLNTNRCVATLEAHTRLVKCIKQLDDGRLASGSDDGTIKVWDLNTNRCVVTLEAHTRFVSCINQLDDRRLVSDYCDGTIKVWDLNTNRCIAPLDEHRVWARCIEQLNDGGLVFASADGTIKVWNLYPDLSFEQIALVVQLERCYQQSEVVNLGDGWRHVFVTLPDYFQKRFQLVSSCFSAIVA